METLSPKELSAAVKISPSYASMILSGSRSPSLLKAFQIYDATGLQFGPLSNLTPRDIETQRRLTEKTKAA